MRNPRAGTRCGLEAGHEGEHTVLIPTGYPWAPHHRDVDEKIRVKGGPKQYKRGAGPGVTRATLYARAFKLAGALDRLAVGRARKLGFTSNRDAEWAAGLASALRDALRRFPPADL